MKKFKKAALTAASYVSVAALAIGGTVAYLTDRSTATNPFTMGDVEIELNEDFVDGSQLMPGVDIKKEATITNTGKNDAYVWMTIAIPSALEGGSLEASSDNILHWNQPGAFWEGYHDKENYIKSAIDAGYLPEGSTGVDKTQTWDHSLAGETIAINGESYYVTTLLYNGILSEGEETTLGLSKVYLDTHVDYNVNDGKYYWVENGNATLINYDLSKTKIYVDAYAVQAEGFDSVEDAYAAYNKQWGDNGDVIRDEINYPSSNDELAESVAKGEDVVISDDIATDSNIVQNGGAIIGGGNTIDGTSNLTEGRSDCVITSTGGSISNLTVDGGFRGIGAGSSGTYKMSEDLYIDNVTVTGTTYGINIGGGNGKNLYVEDSTICDWNSYGGLGGASFTNCTFTSEGQYYAMQRISADATFTFTDCNFEQNIYKADSETEAPKYMLESYGNGTIVLENCYMDGVLVTADNVNDLFAIDNVTVIVK